MLKLFNDAILDLSSTDQKQVHEIEEKNRDELKTFLAKVANITRETRLNHSSSADVRSPALYHNNERKMLEDTV